MNGIVIGLAVCVAVMGLGGLALAYLMLRRFPPNDLSWIREIIFSVRASYAEGYNDGKADKPSKRKRSDYVPPPPQPTPQAQADETFKIGEN